MKVTINDVAKEAGVSITTVSRVINGNYPVRESTKRKVKDAIEKLQFEPNVLARGLINQKSDTIGVIVPSITNLFFPTVVKAIEKKLRHKGYSIYLCDTDGEPEKEISYIKSLTSRQVDGIIIIDPTIDNMRNGYFEEISTKVSLVCINGYNKGIRCNFVLNDEETGAFQVMDYLLSLGHQDIVFLRGKDSYSYEIKEEVYRKMMRKNNLEAHINIVNIGEGNTEYTVDEAMKRTEKLLKDSPQTTAIFACNDIMALGVVNGCRRAGKSVPQDISVIGFDNIALSALIQPKLTTVDQNMYELGNQASEMLLSIIETASKTTRKVVLNPVLIERESCVEKQ